MQYVKEFKKINNSINAVSFTQQEKRFMNIDTGDFVCVNIMILKKAYKCNHCKNGICYFDITTQQETDDMEIKCVECGIDTKLLYAVPYGEYLSTINAFK